MKRIVVIGTSCVGKTTVAAKISEIIDAPHIELDQYNWLPNWQMRDNDELRSIVNRLTDGDRWVVDGNYGHVRDIVWSRATHIVWLDFAFVVVFYRALRRTVRRIVFREELFSGNRETFKGSFLSKDSILLWVLKTHFRWKRLYPDLFNKYENKHLKIIRLKNQKKTDKFIDSIR
jgi:adenylate kinase family enzyme